MLVAKYEPGRKGNLSHIVPATAEKLKQSEQKPGLQNLAIAENAENSIVKPSGIKDDGDKPLCMLFLTFSDNENKEVTTAHVFTNTKPQLYPQTRKTVYKSPQTTGEGDNLQMSLTSPSLYTTDDENYERTRLGSTANTKSSSTFSTPSQYYDNQLVQEVSLSYSAPYTSVVKHHEPLAVNVGSNGNVISAQGYSRVYDRNDFHSQTYLADHSTSRSYRQPYPIPVVVKKTEGKIETEFPAERPELSDVAIPYFSAQSAIQSAKTTPAHTPRAPSIVDSRASTIRLPSSLSHNTVISECTTIEELTTITTTNRSTRKNNDMPTVNALAEQFEENARRERKDALKVRNEVQNEQKSKSNGRVVVINRSNQQSNANNSYNSQRHRPYYSPTGIITTTIVDIEPSGYGKKSRIEEYILKEEYRSTSYPQRKNGENRQYQNRETQANEKQVSEESTKEKAVEIFVRSQSRSGVKSGEHDRALSSDDTISQASPTVKHVIEQFETKIEESVRTFYDKENMPRSVSRVEMNQPLSDDIIRDTEKVVVKTDKIVKDGWKTRPTDVPPPVPDAPSKVTEKSIVDQVQPFVQTYEEERHLIVRSDGSHGKVEQIVRSEPPKSINTSKNEEVKTTAPPPPTPVTPIKDTITNLEENQTTLNETTITTTTTKKVSVDKKEQSPVTSIPTLIPADKIPTQHEYEPEEKVEAYLKEKELSEAAEKLLNNTKQQEDFEQQGKEENSTMFSRTFDREYNVNSYEEISTTRTNRRDNETEPKESFYSSNDAIRNRRTESRLTNGSYVEGSGLRSGIMLSGISSAGQICTIQIRDARQREKKEIEILNNLLADYIEKVRFLEAHNKTLSHHIENLQRGVSNSYFNSIFDTELKQAKAVLKEYQLRKTTCNEEIERYLVQIEETKKKWLDAVKTVKSHRGEFDVNLEKLSNIEAETSLLKRKIRIIEEENIRIRHENDRILSEISNIRSNVHHEVSLKNDYYGNVQSLLLNIKQLKEENIVKINHEVEYSSSNVIEEQRIRFREELRSAIRDIRVKYEEINRKNIIEIEEWYRRTVITIKNTFGIGSANNFKHEIDVIRTTLKTLREKVSEVESRNSYLLSSVEDLQREQAESARLYGTSLSEKNKTISRVKEQCIQLTLELERLCDHETSLHLEIAKYRQLLSTANVTTYTSSVAPLQRIQTTTETIHSSSNYVVGTGITGTSENAYSSSTLSGKTIQERHSNH